jgi:hypothetical protein
MFLAVLLTAYVWKNWLLLGTTDAAQDATKVVEGSAKGAVAGAKNAMKR